MENELRRDYFLDRQVIIAVGRGKRPTDYKHGGAGEEDGGKACFFCPGNEHTTPPEISRIGEGGRWVVRVFPNKFPAVKPEGGEAADAVEPAYGYHEVVVESPEHGETVADLSVDRIAEVLEVYSRRIDYMLSDPRVKYALVFKNHGKTAGASLSHTHTQIISLPVVPELVRMEAEAAGRYSGDKGTCPICDAWKKESKGPRAVWEDGKTAAFAPYASRSPMEAWIMPKRHVRQLSELTGEERLSLAEGLKLVLRRLNEGLGNPPYNMYFHVSPADGDLHLHAEILPRLSVWAGFEMGSGIMINTMPPETAAGFYRSGGNL